MLDAAKSNEKPSVVQLRMVKASQPNNLITGVGMGFKEVLLSLGATETKETRMDPNQWVAQTTLYFAELNQTPSDMFLNVKVEAAIKNRKSGDVVWSETEERTVPILPLLNGRPNPKATIQEKAKLFGSSEYDIREAVLAATAEIGRDLGQQIRNAPTKWDVAPGR
jgi:hypothetical protein